MILVISFSRLDRLLLLLPWCHEGIKLDVDKLLLSLSCREGIKSSCCEGDVAAVAML